MKSMTIGKKLLMSFGAALALTLVVGLVAFESFGSLAASLNKVINVNARKQFLAGDINVAASECRSLERGVLLRSYMKDKATVEKYNQQFGENLLKMRKRIDEFTPLIEAEEARQLVDQLRAAETEVRQNHEELMRVLGNTESEAAANLYTQKALPRLTQAGQTAERLTQQQSELMAAVSKSAEASVARSRWMTTWSLPLTAVTMLCRLPDYAACYDFWLTPPGF